MDSRSSVQLLCLRVAVTLLTGGVVSRDVTTAISQSTLAGITAATRTLFSTNCVFLIYVGGQMGEWIYDWTNVYVCMYIYVNIKLYEL
jgi:hypothetical protein